MTGEPETNPQALDPDNPFTKLFRASMHNLPQDPVSVLEKVVVVGDKVISEYFSVPLPRYQPLTVVQDPPGGLSTATYSKAYANFVVESHAHEEYHGFYFTTGLAPIKVETGVQQCVGLGAAVCTKVADTESTPLKLTVDQSHMFGTQDGDDNYGTERVWSFTIDLTTSDNPRRRKCRLTRRRARPASRPRSSGRWKGRRTRRCSPGFPHLRLRTKRCPT